MLKALTRILPIAGLLLLTAAPARAADEKQVKESVQRAITYLKSSLTQGNQNQPPPQGPQGLGGGAGGGITAGGYGEGPIALAGIALLEAGVGRQDPIIESIARQVRSNSIDQNQTYQL